jgi:hypothetical protein
MSFTLPECSDREALGYACKVGVRFEGPWGPQLQLSQYTAV